MLATKEGYYVGHPTVKVGTRLRCIQETDQDGLNDTCQVDVHNLNFYKYYAPTHYEIIK